MRVYARQTHPDARRARHNYFFLRCSVARSYARDAPWLGISTAGKVKTQKWHASCGKFSLIVLLFGSCEMMMENVEMDELAVILLMFANLWRARNLAKRNRKKLDTKMTIRKHAENTTTKTCKRKQVISTASRTIISWRNNDSPAKSMQVRSWNAHARRRK